ncbi:hypothetical protein D0N87_29710, partial [Pseudomonas sp. ATCC 13867]
LTMYNDYDAKIGAKGSVTNKPNDQDGPSQSAGGRLLAHAVKKRDEPGLSRWSAVFFLYAASASMSSSEVLDWY